MNVLFLKNPAILDNSFDISASKAAVFRLFGNFDQGLCGMEGEAKVTDNSSKRHAVLSLKVLIHVKVTRGLFFRLCLLLQK